MAGTELQATPGKIIRFAEDWTISPTVVNHFAYGYNRFVNSDGSYSATFQVRIGLRCWASRTWAVPRLPVISWKGYDSYALGSGLYPQMGNGWRDRRGVNGSNIISDDLTWITAEPQLPLRVRASAVLR